MSVFDEFHDFSPYDTRLDDLRTNVKLIKTVMDEMDISGIKSYVEQILARKSTLDSLREVICCDDKFNKKPGLFSKPNKEDGIRYTTGIQIKNKSAGQYIVTYSGNRVDLSVLELIYLGLAERI